MGSVLCLRGRRPRVASVLHLIRKSKICVPPVSVLKWQSRCALASRLREVIERKWTIIWTIVLRIVTNKLVPVINSNTIWHRPRSTHPPGSGDETAIEESIEYIIGGATMEEAVSIPLEKKLYGKVNGGEAQWFCFTTTEKENCTYNVTAVHKTPKMRELYITSPYTAVTRWTTCWSCATRKRSSQLIARPGI